MKLHANIAESEIEIELHDQGPRVLAVIDGREYDVDVQTSRDNHYLLICDAQVFDCRVEGAPESGSTFEVIVGTNRHAVTLTDPRRLRGAPPSIWRRTGKRSRDEPSPHGRGRRQGAAEGRDELKRQVGTDFAES